MSETETSAAPFEAPEAVLYTDRNGNVRVALVLEAQTDESPAKLRVLRSNNTTMVRVASLDAESGTYKRAADPAPELPSVVGYTDHNGNVRPAVVLDPATEAVKVRVLRDNGTTYVRTVSLDADGTYHKVPEPSFGYSDYDADESDEDSDSDL